MNTSVNWVVRLIVAVAVTMTWRSAAIAETGVEIGVIKNVKGTVTISRDSESISVVTGLSLLENDIITTGGKSSVGVIFKDNSVLSLGPKSRIEMKDFVFEPAEKKLSFVAEVVRGTMTYLSGIITRLNPDAVEFRTPSATIGIRGTHIAIQVQ